MLRRFNSYFAMVVIVITIACAFADEWSYFVPVGNSVSTSFARVDATTYTWRFRNDGYNKVKYMEFAYSYIDAGDGQYKTDTDVLPGSLSPGEVFGGWAAFTATTRAQPSIRITRIERE
jgi:hypothetical protein